MLNDQSKLRAEVVTVEAAASMAAADVATACAGVATIERTAVSHRRWYALAAAVILAAVAYVMW
jgi:hypothetical protein